MGILRGRPPPPPPPPPLQFSVLVPSCTPSCLSGLARVSQGNFLCVIGNPGTQLAPWTGDDLGVLCGALL